MSDLISRPAPLALALSQAFGRCVPYPVTALRWYPCPDCARTMGRRLTACKVCDGSGRLAVFR